MSIPNHRDNRPLRGPELSPLQYRRHLESQVTDSVLEVDYVPGHGVNRYQSEIDNSLAVRAR